ncbi:MAG: DMT family transporter [Bacteroidetes bacterium]|nr:DMT family transporter [Bacteroidota bacterium]
MKSNPSVYWALLMVSLLYGLNYIIAKDVMPLYLSSTTFIALRLFVCTILFWIIGIFFKKERIHTNDIPLIIFCAFLGAAFNQLTFFKGLSLTTPINAALLMILVPILVFLFSTFFGKEKWIGINLLGIILGFVGAFLIIASNSKGGVFNIRFSKGDFFIFLNALSFALYLVFSKPLIGKYSPLFLMKWFFLIAFFMVLPFAYSGLFTTEWQIIPNIIWIKIAYVILGATFSVYLLNAYALSKANPSLVGIFIYLQPVFATLFSILLKKDSLDKIKIIAASLIFMGVYLVNKSKVVKN